MRLPTKFGAFIGIARPNRFEVTNIGRFSDQPEDGIFVAAAMINSLVPTTAPVLTMTERGIMIIMVLAGIWSIY